jgi:hypothetical protein
MKKMKLKIEDFLGNKLDNPIMINGGDGTNPAPTSGGSNTTGGNGSGDTPPGSGPFGNPQRPTGPIEAPDVP